MKDERKELKNAICNTCKWINENLDHTCIIDQNSIMPEMIEALAGLTKAYNELIQ